MNRNDEIKSNYASNPNKTVQPVGSEMKLSNGKSKQPNGEKPLEVQPKPIAC
jgi:hypothetical protein